MTIEPEYFTGGFEIPQANSAVFRSRKHMRIIGVKADTMNTTDMTGKGFQNFTRVRIPQTHCRIPRARDKAGTIVGEFEIENSIGMACIMLNFFAGFDFPQDDGAVITT